MSVESTLTCFTQSVLTTQVWLRTSIFLATEIFHLRNSLIFSAHSFPKFLIIVLSTSHCSIYFELQLVRVREILVDEKAKLCYFTQGCPKSYQKLR